MRSVLGIETDGKKSPRGQKAPAKFSQAANQASGRSRSKGAGIQELREARGDTRPSDMQPGSPRSTQSPVSADMNPFGSLAMQRPPAAEAAPCREGEGHQINVPEKGGPSTVVGPTHSEGEDPSDLKTRERMEDEEFEANIDSGPSKLPPEKAPLYRRYLPTKVAEKYEWLMEQVEPPPHTPVARFVQGPFDKVCTLVIILNAIVTFMNTNWAIENYGQDSEVYKAIDVLFVIFYSTELVLKLVVHKYYFFWNENMHWNCFDFFLVCTGIYDQMTNFFLAGSGSLDLVFLRILRLLKMAKILRVFRLVRSLSVLRLILNSILGSMSSLIWSIVMMAIIFFMFGLVFVQNTAGYFADKTALGVMTDEEIQDSELMRRFSTVQQTMIGLYMSCTGGDDWRNFYDVLVPVGSMTAGAYLFFVAFSQIALMNILTGIFVENAMSLAVPDRQAQFSEEQRKFRAQHEELQTIITGMDVDGDGCINLLEFRNGMETEGPGSLKTYLGAAGIHEADAEHFYHSLRSAQFGQNVDIASFVGGCMKLRGEAKSLDMQALGYELKVVHKKVHDIHAELAKGHMEAMEVAHEVEMVLEHQATAPIQHSVGRAFAV